MYPAFLRYINTDKQEHKLLVNKCGNHLSLNKILFEAIFQVPISVSSKVLVQPWLSFQLTTNVVSFHRTSFLPLTEFSIFALYCYGKWVLERRTLHFFCIAHGWAYSLSKKTSRFNEIVNIVRQNQATPCISKLEKWDKICTPHSVFVKWQ